MEDLKLTPEQVKNLKASEVVFVAVRKQLNRMKKVGIDVNKQLADLEHSDKVRKNMIREFGK